MSKHHLVCTFIYIRDTTRGGNVQRRESKKRRVIKYRFSQPPHLPLTSRKKRDVACMHTTSMLMTEKGEKRKQSIRSENRCTLWAISKSADGDFDWKKADPHEKQPVSGTWYFLIRRWMTFNIYNAGLVCLFVGHLSPSRCGLLDENRFV